MDERGIRARHHCCGGRAAVVHARGMIPATGASAGRGGGQEGRIRQTSEASGPECRGARRAAVQTSRTVYFSRG